MGVEFKVEKGKKVEDRIRVPVLFGRNGVLEKSFLVDAFHEETGTVLEVEAGGVWVELMNRGSDHPLELNYYPPESRFYENYVEGSELDHLAFACDDVQRDYKKALAGGAISAVEPWEEGGSTLAFVGDPDGVWIELHSRT